MTMLTHDAAGEELARVYTIHSLGEFLEQVCRE